MNKVTLSFLIVGLFAGIFIGISVNAAWAQSATPPGAPTNLSVTADSTSIKLSWTAPTSDGGRPIIGYVIERDARAPGVGPATFGSACSTKSFGGAPFPVANTGSASTTYIDKIPRVLYDNYYRVCAINAQGTGSPSNVVSTNFVSMFGMNPPQQEFEIDKSGNFYLLGVDGIYKFDSSGKFVSKIGWTRGTGEGQIQNAWE